MAVYDIRFARPDERPQLMSFIHQHWRPGHILSLPSQAPLFDWQYLNRERDHYNFVVAVDGRGEFQAILGFIPLSQFDHAIPISRIIWLAIWKVTEAAAGQRLGDRLLTWLDGFFTPEIIAANAISESATHRYRQRGYQIGKLNHWFITRPSSGYHLASIGDAKPARSCDDSANHIMKIFPSEFADTCRWSSMKTTTYYINRYFKHPTYSYDAYQIHYRGRAKAIFIARTCRANGATAMRIVEYIGPSEPLIGLRKEWDRLLRVTGDEYLDFYNVGIGRETMELSGFHLREDGDGYVIPNYYEPYARRNVEIDTMTSVAVPADFRIFKGDSDQDRPNMVSE